MYLDDVICAPSSEVEYHAAKLIVLGYLNRAGFALSLKKCVLDPIQKGRWLDFILDVAGGSFFVPKEKVCKLKSCSYISTEIE